MKYLVRVREVCFKDVIVEANDEYEAEEIVEELLLCGRISVNECEDETVECVRKATESDMKFHQHVEKMEGENDE